MSAQSSGKEKRSIEVLEIVGKGGIVCCLIGTDRDGGRFVHVGGGLAGASFDETVRGFDPRLSAKAIAGRIERTLRRKGIRPLVRARAVEVEAPYGAAELSRALAASRLSKAPNDAG